MKLEDIVLSEINQTQKDKYYDSTYTPVLLPGKSHGRRSLVGYSPWGHKESDTTKRLHFTSILYSYPLPNTELCIPMCN